MPHAVRVGGAKISRTETGTCAHFLDGNASPVLCVRRAEHASVSPTTDEVGTLVSYVQTKGLFVHNDAERGEAGYGTGRQLQ